MLMHIGIFVYAVILLDSNDHIKYVQGMKNNPLS